LKECGNEFEPDYEFGSGFELAAQFVIVYCRTGSGLVSDVSLKSWQFSISGS